MTWQRRIAVFGEPLHQERDRDDGLMPATRWRCNVAALVAPAKAEALDLMGEPEAGQRLVAPLVWPSAL